MNNQMYLMSMDLLSIYPRPSLDFVRPPITTRLMILFLTRILDATAYYPERTQELHVPTGKISQKAREERYKGILWPTCCLIAEVVN